MLDFFLIFYNKNKVLIYFKVIWNYTHFVSLVLSQLWRVKAVVCVLKNNQPTHHHIKV